MRIRVHSVKRGDQTIEMIKLVKEQGQLGLSAAKKMVDQLLLGQIGDFEFECFEPDPYAVVRQIEALGFGADLITG